MKRVYYSGYIPVSDDSRLPALDSEVPMMRENRLYQTDWLVRFYGFDVREILNDHHQNLDMDIDPKLSWALRNMDQFPVDVNLAPKHLLQRIPGVGMKSVGKILASRRVRKLNWDNLKLIGISFNRAKYFITCDSRQNFANNIDPFKLKNILLSQSKSKYAKHFNQQLQLF